MNCSYVENRLLTNSINPAAKLLLYLYMFDNHVIHFSKTIHKLTSSWSLRNSIALYELLNPDLISLRSLLDCPYGKLYSYHVGHIVSVYIMGLLC